MTAEILARFSRYLIQAEERPGGPYRTWIMTDYSRGWDDIDVGVNANVAYALGVQGVFLESLDRFLREKALTLSFDSLYYHSPAIVVYYLSRYFSLRPGHAEAAEAIERLSKACAGMIAVPENILETALATCALRRFGRGGLIDRAVEDILDAQREDGLWSAYPLYREKVRDGRTEYYASEAVTTAFCVEALALYLQQSRIQSTCAEEDEIFEKALSSVRTAFRDDLDCFKDDAETILGRFAASGNDRTIILLAYSFYTNLNVTAPIGRPIDRDTLVRLGAANLWGWMGYTMQDDMLDDLKGFALLPFANICLRRSLQLFTCEAPDRATRGYIHRILDRIDRANRLEQQEKGDEDTISAKSFGHALGPLIVLAQLGRGPQSAGFQSLEKFFRHYIAARQMCDDAHDWERDLEQGRRTLVTDVILAARGEDRTRSLREVFWHRVIDRVVQEIRHQLSAAEASLKENRAFDSSIFGRSLLEPLERSAERALSERDRALEFIRAFGPPRANTATASKPRTS